VLSSSSFSLPQACLCPDSLCSLDTLTSGALVLARHRECAGLLSRDFRLKRVHKYYVALSDRRPSKKMGSVVGDMQVNEQAA
jgi:tRNA pseudouridine32 synthase/23S rRNA pseudouridine746 synthase